MGSPFIFGRVATGNNFTNRVTEKLRLTNNFKHKINTIIISPRRLGKSSLVHQTVLELANNKKTKFCFIDLFKVRNEEEFYQLFVKSLLRSTAGKVEEWLSTIKLFLGHILPKVSFNITGQDTIDISFSVENIKKDWEDILNLPEKIAIKKNIQIIICLDEFQNISYFNDPTGFQKKLRAIWQHHSHTNYCLYGSKQHMLNELFQKSSMPFYKFGDVTYLEKISAKDLNNFIIEQFKKTGKKISSEFASEITTLMKCHPYHVQELAHYVWLCTKSYVDKKVIELAIDNLFSANTILYQREIEQLTTPQLNFLKALTDGVKTYSSNETIKKYELGSSSHVIRIKEALVKKEIIDTFSSEIIFIDTSFELWFKIKYLQC